MSSLVQQSLSDNILQHLQLRAPQGSVRPFCLPRARLLSLTTRFLMLGPVLLTNWNRLFLGFPVSVSFVGGAGVRNPLSLLFALADLVLGTLRLGLADLEHNMIINQRVHMSQHQSRMIELQDQVISLQERLLTAKEGLSKARKVSEDFKTEIVNTFQKEVSSVKQSFSDVVKSGSLKTSAATISTESESIKSVAKQIALEEELGRNIIVFGLCEEENEDICSKVSDVLESLGEKPRVEACRIGKKSPSATRPVKVSLSSSSIVQQILKNSSKLSGTEKFKRVFLAPDRTAEEKAHRKELVLELKRRAEVDKDKKLFIRGGKICTLERQK